MNIVVAFWLKCLPQKKNIVTIRLIAYFCVFKKRTMKLEINEVFLSHDLDNFSFFILMYRKNIFLQKNELEDFVWFPKSNTSVISQSTYK